ncbi:MAG: putative potassium transport system protein kup [Bacteroidia bacterium]|nr:MAG: putative potassium transport system protein kup [Bacteroidia bacterium]
MIGILTILFFIQQFGTKAVGKLFGPIMFTWFCMLAILGIINLSNDWSILKALNPYYALDLLINYPDGFWVLGAVFLCTTGAEGIYSDLGHCGKKNIRITWGFVKFALVLNYFGQGAWLLTQEGQHLKTSPFYGIMPEWFLPLGIAVATAAAIVASQALISGSFTLINEAMRLNLWPKVRINYPTEIMGQLYIPSVNLILWLGCMSIVFIFGSSEHMEAAYGLAIITTMIMTTILLIFYLKKNHYPLYFIIGLGTLLTLSEGAFFIANMSKFVKGGYVMIIIAFILAFIMWVMYSVRNIKDEYNEFVNLKDYLGQLGDLSKDESLPKYASHLVYLTSGKQEYEVENKIIYSIFQKQPKRADIYWFIHVSTDPTPYKMEYKVNIMKQDDVIRIDFNLGFRIAPRINIFLRKVIQDLVANNEVNIISRYPSLRKYNITGDFRFVVLDKFLSNENEDMPFLRKLVLNFYFFLRRLSLSEEQAFGLDTSQVTVEKVPLIIKQPKDIQLKRVY